MASQDDVDSFFSSVGSRLGGRVADAANRDTVLMRAFGRRLRAARVKLGMTQLILAQEAGVSHRYVRQAEVGEGNVSLRILLTLAHSLAVDPVDLLADRPDSPLHRLADRLDPGQRADGFRVLRRHFERQPDDPRAGRIALVGLPGAGKTALGTRLARERSARFVVFDDAVAVAAGAAVGDVFQRFSHGAVQRLHCRVLEEILADAGGLVLAVDAGVATLPQTLGLLLRSCRTVWLRLSDAAVLQRAPEGLGRPGVRHLRMLMAAQEAMLMQADLVLDVSGRAGAENFAALLELGGRCG